MGYSLQSTHKLCVFLYSQHANRKFFVGGLHEKYYLVSVAIDYNYILIVDFLVCRVYYGYRKKMMVCRNNY